MRPPCSWRSRPHLVMPIHPPSAATESPWSLPGRMKRLEAAAPRRPSGALPSGCRRSGRLAAARSAARSSDWLPCRPAKTIRPCRVALPVWPLSAHRQLASRFAASCPPDRRLERQRSVPHRLDVRLPPGHQHPDELLDRGADRHQRVPCPAAALDRRDVWRRPAGIQHARSMVCPAGWRTSSPMPGTSPLPAGASGGGCTRPAALGLPHTCGIITRSPAIVSFSRNMPIQC